MPAPTRRPEAAAPPPSRIGPANGPGLADSLARLGAPIPWAIGLLCLVLAVSGALGAAALRDRIAADAKRKLTVVASSIAAITEERLTAIDTSLRRVVLLAGAEALATQDGQRSLGDMLAIEQQGIPLVYGLAVVDARGRLLAASRATIAGGRTEPGAAWSNIAALRDGAVAVIGDARDGGRDGLAPGTILVISRGIVAGTALVGAAEAILRIDGDDGLLHVPPLADGLHLSLHHTGGGQLVERSGASSEEPATIGLVATAPLALHGLTVTASRPLESVLAAWRSSMWAIGTVTLILCLSGIGLALLARRLTRRQAALARAALQRAETADAIADTLDIMLWSMDARTRRYTHLSPSVERITGHRRGAFYRCADAWLALVHPDDSARAREAFARMPDAASVTYRIRTATGGEVMLRDSARAVRDAKGEVIRYDGMAIDVTHQKRTQAALDEARRIANLGAWQINLADQRIEWSPEVFTHFRVDPARFDVTLDRIMAMIHPDDEAMVRGKLAEAAEGAEADFDFRLIRGDGTTGWFWSEARLVRDSDGVPVRIYGVCHDITDRKLAEERAARASQLAALGELTGGIAHDFNNLLAVVKLNLEIVADELADPALRDCLANAATAAEQGTKLTSQLLAFARRQPAQGGRVEIGAALRRVRRMLDHGLGRRIRLTVDVDPDTIEVATDEAQFDSAVMNLALNARDAMPVGGTIAIAARALRLEPAEAGALGLSPGAYARLTITDDGQGMSEETRARAFEPFFTTKRGGKGNGLGLAMVYGFVKQARGEISLDSAPGRGTTVTLWLPLAAAAAGTAQPVARACPLAGTVLLVEDEQALREVGTRLLQEAGYTVHAAASAEAALALLGTLSTPPDLLFTDIMLEGGGNGFALARAVRALSPGIAVLYTSGYVGESEPSETDAPILRKPFGAAALREAVAEALAGREEAPRSAA